MATKKSASTTRRRSEGGFLIGIFVGVVLGLAVALGNMTYLQDTLQLGNDLMVAVKVQLHRGGLPTEDAINRVESELKRRFPQVKWSFFEPDVAD